MTLATDEAPAGPPQGFARPWAAAMAATAAFACSQPVSASTPSLTWQGVDRVGVQCVVNSADHGVSGLQTTLCERVRALAAEDAPVAVRVTPPGDPAVLRPGTVTLLVHGGVHAAPGGRALAFTIRPFRATPEDAVLFGTTPRVALLPAAGVAGPALDAALRAALSETLPWSASEANAPRPLAHNAD